MKKYILWEADPLGAKFSLLSGDTPEEAIRTKYPNNWSVVEDIHHSGMFNIHNDQGTLACDDVLFDSDKTSNGFSHFSESLALYMLDQLIDDDPTTISLMGT